MRDAICCFGAVHLPSAPVNRLALLRWSINGQYCQADPCTWRCCRSTAPQGPCAGAAGPPAPGPWRRHGWVGWVLSSIWMQGPGLLPWRWRQCPAAAVPWDTCCMYAPAIDRLVPSASTHPSPCSGGHAPPPGRRCARAGGTAEQQRRARARPQPQGEGAGSLAVCGRVVSGTGWQRRNSAERVRGLNVKVKGCGNYSRTHRCCKVASDNPSSMDGRLSLVVALPPAGYCCLCLCQI